MTVIEFEKHFAHPDNKVNNPFVLHSGILDPDGVLEIYKSKNKYHERNLDGNEVIYDLPVNKEITFFTSDKDFATIIQSHTVNIDIVNTIVIKIFEGFDITVDYNDIYVKDFKKYFIPEKRDVYGYKIVRSSTNKLNWIGIFLGDEKDIVGSWKLFYECWFHNYLEKPLTKETVTFAIDDIRNLSIREIEEVKPFKPDHVDFYRLPTKSR